MVKARSLILIMFLVGTILSGCSGGHSVHRGVHEYRSQGLEFQDHHEVEFDVSPHTRRLTFQLSAEFAGPVRFEVVDPAGGVAHRQSFDRVTTTFDLQPRAGEWLIRFSAEQPASGDYFLRIRER